MSTCTLPSRWRPAILGGSLVLAHLPFVCSGALTDDAFITWRCALQLADTGVYGFNPGERVSASTSHAYVALVALLRVVFGSAFLPAVLLLASVFVVMALKMVADSVAESANERERLWVLSALSPSALVVVSSGMETSLLLLAFAVGVRGLSQAPPNGRVPWAPLLALFLLPWVRLDGIFAALALAIAHAARDRRLAAKAVLAALLGTLAVLLFNWGYFGVIVNQSIHAKLEGFHRSHAPSDVMLRVLGIYFSNEAMPSAFMPLPTKFLRVTGPLFALASMVAFGLLVRGARRLSARQATVGALAVVSLGAPAIYAAVGVVYPWYLWPAVLLGGVAVLGVLLERLALVSAARPGLARLLGVALAGIVALGAMGEWALSYAAGVRESAYTTSVGRFVGASSKPGERLFTDLAGSVPYFSGLPTDDDASLVSPLVTDYKQRYGEGWAARFLGERQPTWVVLRSSLEEELGEAAAGGVAGEGSALRAEVLGRYELVRRFRYDARDFVGSGWRVWLAGLSTAYDFWVYRVGAGR